MKSYDDVKQEYESFKLEMSSMYKKEREILERLQNICPHENSYNVIGSVFDPFDDEEEPKRKCKECGKIL